MRAVVMDPGLRFEPHAPEPVVPVGEVLVRVRLCGICRTDTEIARGYMGFQGIPGHEFVGEVVEPEHHPLVGRRVVGEINCPCGGCPMCRRGLEHHCPQRTVLGIDGRDGALAEFLALPPANLHVVDDETTDVQAVFTEPLAAALEILEQVPISSSDRVLVLGDGKLGLLVVLALQRTARGLYLSGRHPDRMARLEPCHATWLAPDEEPGEPFDVVVEATGRREGLARALALVRPRGTVVVKTTVAGAHELNLAPLVVDEITLVGSRCGPFRPALRALSSGAIHVERLVDRTFPLDLALEALEYAQRPGVLKVLVAP